jgi:transcription antitermination factor NusG
MSEATDNPANLLAGDAAAPAPAPAPSTKRWYVVHAYSGMEKAVERNLRERIDRSGMQDKFGRILVPMEEVVELKNGKKAVTERRFFPGYVLVEMDMADDTWHLVKHTSKVTGFVGGAKNRPSPISEAEVMKIVNQMQEGIETAITTSPRCVSRSRSSAGPPRSNWISGKSKKCEPRSGWVVGQQAEHPTDPLPRVA